MERIFQDGVIPFEDNINKKIEKLKAYVEQESIKAQDEINKLLEEIITKISLKTLILHIQLVEKMKLYQVPTMVWVIKIL